MISFQQGAFYSQAALSQECHLPSLKQQPVASWETFLPQGGTYCVIGEAEIGEERLAGERDPGKTMALGINPKLSSGTINQVCVR